MWCSALTKPSLVAAIVALIVLGAVLVSSPELSEMQTDESVQTAVQTLSVSSAAKGPSAANGSSSTLHFGPSAGGGNATGSGGGGGGGGGGGSDVTVSTNSKADSELSVAILVVGQNRNLAIHPPDTLLAHKLAQLINPLRSENRVSVFMCTDVEEVDVKRRLNVTAWFAEEVRPPSLPNDRTHHTTS